MFFESDIELLKKEFNLGTNFRMEIGIGQENENLKFGPIIEKNELQIFDTHIFNSGYHKIYRVLHSR